MDKKFDIHPSIIEALEKVGETELVEKLTATDEDDEELEDQFSFGNEEPTILKAIEAIIQETRNSNLDNSIFYYLEKPFEYLGKRLELEEPAVLMLALLVGHYADLHIDMTDFIEHLRCTSLQLLPYLKHIDTLEERGYVICNRSGRRPTYRVPYEVLEAINRNEPLEEAKLTDLSSEDLMNEVNTIFDQYDEHELSTEALMRRLNTLLSSNPHLHLVKQLKTYKLDNLSQMLLMYFADQLINENEYYISNRQMFLLINNRQQWSCIRQQLAGNKHPLQEKGLIEFSHDGGFGNREAYSLTMQAKRTLFSEFNIKNNDEEVLRKGLTHHEDITCRQLFYDEKVEHQVEELASLLNEEHYQQILQRLQDKGFRCGFTCLFYGSPGTGKTETVLQLARQTGRDIMQVNVSEIKSKWVGDSEKNIKALFDDYRQKVKDCKRTPILLFNEADAIINRRQEMAERGVDKMENSIQNIILQEMETLDGILIATTNLEQNMDKAFERRFLYKIKFNKPSVEARQHIWQSMIPSLSADAALQLASSYDFSGGQIENIARHHTIDSILHGAEADDLQSLITHCDQERLEKKVRRIGF